MGSLTAAIPRRLSSADDCVFGSFINPLVNLEGYPIFQRACASSFLWFPLGSVPGMAGLGAMGDGGPGDPRPASDGVGDVFDLDAR